jgi:hypothetical protein
MFYSDKFKVVFVARPKTGTRSIYDVLEKNFNGKLFKEHHAEIPQQFNNYFSFCTVRNPYDRACSMWWSTSKRGLDKRGFVKKAQSHGWDNTMNSFMKVVKELTVNRDRILRTQAMFINPNRIDAKLRFDHLEEDFNKLPFVKDYIELPSLNVTKEKTGPNPHARPPWQTMMDEEVVSLINEIYSADFALSGYKKITDFDAWKKEQEDE